MHSVSGAPLLKIIDQGDGVLGEGIASVNANAVLEESSTTTELRPPPELSRSFAAPGC